MRTTSQGLVQKINELLDAGSSLQEIFGHHEVGELICFSEFDRLLSDNPLSIALVNRIQAMAPEDEIIGYYATMIQVDLERNQCAGGDYNLALVDQYIGRLCAAFSVDMREIYTEEPAVPRSAAGTGVSVFDGASARAGGDYDALAGDEEEALRVKRKGRLSCLPSCCRR